MNKPSSSKSSVEKVGGGNIAVTAWNIYKTYGLWVALKSCLTFLWLVLWRNAKADAYLYNRRMATCGSCPIFNPAMGTCGTPGVTKSGCYCPMSAKANYRHATCWIDDKCKSLNPNDPEDAQHIQNLKGLGWLE